MKKEFILAIFLLLINFSSAAIILSEPADIYNLGDKLYVSVDGLIGTENGNLNIELVCGTNTTISLVKIPARAFSSEKEQSYSLPYKILSKEDLEISNLSQIIGNCQVTASLGNLFSATKFFTITDAISVNAKLDKVAYDPEEQITFSIDALKANGQPLEGYILAGNATDMLKAITAGNFKDVFAMAKTSEPGLYTLDILAYDSDADGGILNSGRTSINFVVNQIPSSIVISLSEETITPGQSLKAGIEVFDQSGKKMDGIAKVRIISPKEEQVEMEVKSGDNVEFELPTNATAGIWKMYAIFENIVEEREFTVNELQKVEFDIVDSVLEVKNVGNVLYNKTIEIAIGDEKRELELKINVGETRKFNLKAPKGEYDVVVGDGESSINKQVVLTGNAISIRDLESVGIFKGYSLVWLFLLLILVALFIVFMRRRQLFNSLQETKIASGVRKVGQAVRTTVENNVPRSVSKSMNESMNLTSKSPAVQSLDSSNHSHDDKSMLDLTDKSEVKHVESNFTMSGKKYHSAIISLSIKNHKSLGENSIKELGRIVDYAKDSRGLVDHRGDYIFVIFSPVVTKTYNNEQVAIKVASKILQELKNHNKKYNNKIEFNIGIHSGELLTSKAGGKLKYTDLGNTISFSKRIADSNKEKIIISDEIRKKLLRELKVSKSGEIGNKHLYEVSEIKNIQGNEEKLKDLLHRMEEPKKEDD